MRRILLLCSLALLSACSGSSSDEAATCDQQYWDGTVGTCLPEGWHVVDTADLQSRGAPREVLLAFQSDTALAGRFPIVTVTVQTLASGMDGEEFDRQSRESVKTLPGYALVDERDVKVDGQALTLHIFSSQPVAEQPVQRFYQLSVAGDGQGYTFTGVLPVSVEKAEEGKLLTLLTHVTLAEPKEE